MFCVEEWVVVPLMGSEVVWCTLRWPVVWFWPLMVLLLVEEKLKEEEEVMLLEDIVVCCWLLMVVVGVLLGCWVFEVCVVEGMKKGGTLLCALEKPV
jgi:hypothetical protein